MCYASQMHVKCHTGVALIRTPRVCTRTSGTPSHLFRSGTTDMFVTIHPDNGDVTGGQPRTPPKLPSRTRILPATVSTLTPMSS
eukprot:m.131059 g.131059  ORF g.131059 m.131059 type:complete len:84 (+) comp17475_c0_seq27:2082-2333(+)